ncbi:MAG: hypothetical protein FIA95_02905 [Gemmatimonadetes bacterium]|nr:hypothetical protein [Gemmatimonadota bacterium]
MTDLENSELQARREYAQLLRLHDRLLVQLQRTLEELASTQTSKVLKEIRARTGSEPDLTAIHAAIEESIRALKLSQSDIRQTITEHHDLLEVEGIVNLPAHLQRFLAEREQLPGFSYEVVQDEVRGWVICWKEYTPRGTVRGYGQFYERPYAYIDD